MIPSVLPVCRHITCLPKGSKQEGPVDVETGIVFSRRPYPSLLILHRGILGYRLGMLELTCYAIMDTPCQTFCESYAVRAMSHVLSPNILPSRVDMVRMGPQAEAIFVQKLIIMKLCPSTVYLSWFMQLYSTDRPGYHIQCAPESICCIVQK